MLSALASVTETLSQPGVMVLLGIIALVPVINGVLSIIRFFRADPPASDYALRSQVDLELAKLEKRMDARIQLEMGAIRRELAGLHEEVGKINTTIDSEMKSINRALGRLEGLSKS